MFALLPCLLQVTAPVRETAAQALAMALQPLDLPSVQQVVQALHVLQQQDEWRVRYGELQAPSTRATKPGHCAALSAC